MEATAVSLDGLITYTDVGLWDDGTEAAMARVLDGVRRWSPMLISIQLAHAGRGASTEVAWEGGTQIARNGEGGW